MDIYHITQYLLAILAGIIAGIINTLAGSGSLVTLPLLVWLGLDANVANATNRVGILIQNIVGISAFAQRGNLNVDDSRWYVLATIPGGVLGAWLASQLGKQQMDTVIGVVMIMMLFIILFEPERWLREQSEVRKGLPSTWMLLVFFAIGAYGGFIQAGVGVFILAGLVLGAGYTLVHANAIKLVIVLIVTIAAIITFYSVDAGLIHWGFGLLMAVGQSIGAWLAAAFASTAKNANVWVRRLLITVIIVSILDFFGIFEMFLSWA